MNLSGLLINLSLFAALSLSLSLSISISISVSVSVSISLSLCQHRARELHHLLSHDKGLQACTFEFFRSHLDQGFFFKNDFQVLLIAFVVVLCVDAAVTTINPQPGWGW